MKTRKDADLLWGANTMAMKKITFNADEGQLDLAKRIAERRALLWKRKFANG